MSWWFDVFASRSGRTCLRTWREQGKYLISWCPWVIAYQRFRPAAVWTEWEAGMESDGGRKLGWLAARLPESVSSARRKGLSWGVTRLSQYLLLWQITSLYSADTWDRLDLCGGAIILSGCIAGWREAELVFLAKEGAHPDGRVRVSVSG